MDSGAVRSTETAAATNRIVRPVAAIGGSPMVPATTRSSRGGWIRRLTKSQPNTSLLLTVWSLSLY